MFRGELIRVPEPPQEGDRPPPVSLPKPSIREVVLREDGVLELHLSPEADDEVARIAGSAGTIEMRVVRDEF